MAIIPPTKKKLDKETAALLANCYSPITWYQQACELKCLERSEELFEPWQKRIKIEFVIITRHENQNAFVMSQLQMCGNC